MHIVSSMFIRSISERLGGNKMSIRVGIIGCGSIVKHRHAPEYKANPSVSDLVFYDRNIERAEAMAKQFEGSVAHSVEDLLLDTTIEAISDCSSNEYHHIFSTEALLHGKHVLCEKPIALSVEHANQMIEAQKKSGKKLMVAHNQRFTKAHMRAKQIIESNELGNVLTFKTSFGHKGPEHWGTNKTNSTWFFKKNRSGFGVLGDLGIHKIDLLHFLLDDEIEQVCAFQGALDKKDEYDNPIEVCDNIVSSLKTKRGRLGTASFSWTYYGEEDNSTIIYFERGMMKIYDNPTYQIQVIKNNGEKIHYEVEPIQTNDNQSNSGVIDAFIQCIRLDETPPVTGEQALLSLKVVLSMLEAAENGRVVHVS